jgi:hypothetical protein
MRRSGPDGTRFSPAEDDAVRSRPRANFPVWTATLPASARNRALGFRVERLRRGRVLEDFCEAQSRIVQRCARCSDSLEAAISLCRSRGGAIFFFEKCAILFLKIKLRAILYDRLVYSDPVMPIASKKPHPQFPSPPAEGLTRRLAPAPAGRRLWGRERLNSCTRWRACQSCVLVLYLFTRRRPGGDRRTDRRCLEPRRFGRRNRRG